VAVSKVVFDSRMLRNLAPYVWVGVLFSISVALGTVYAIHNTDSHHWGFILGTVLDFSAGRSLFDQVFIQYGAGGPLFFKLVNAVWPLTYTNIGLITVAVYFGTLILLFLSAARLTNVSIAALVTTLAVLIHPYAIYPWGDYFAGFSLMAACFLLTRTGDAAWRPFAAGAFLFFAFLFRNTYLVNISVSLIVYLMLAAFFVRARHRGAVRASITFFAVTLLYFALLWLQDKTGLWFTQNFGAATSSYGVNPGGAGITLIYRLLFPEALWAGVFSALLVIAAYFVLSVSFSKKTEDSGSALGCFVALLGATGFAQGAMIYELFRVQNACVPLFLLLSILIHRLGAQGKEQVASLLRWAVALVAVLFAIRIPAVLAGQPFSTWNPLIAKPFEEKWGSYQKVDGIPILEGHRYQPDVLAYYQSLAKTICPLGRGVVNLTPDPLIPYLCGDRRNQLSIPQYSEDWLRRTSPAELDRVQSGRYQVNELVVADLVHQGGTNYVARFVESGPATGVALKPIAAVPRPASIPWIGGPGVVVLEVVPAEKAQ
jgi:hypothetical protein